MIQMIDMFPLDIINDILEFINTHNCQRNILIVYFSISDKKPNQRTKDIYLDRYNLERNTLLEFSYLDWEQLSIINNNRNKNTDINKKIIEKLGVDLSDDDLFNHYIRIMSIVDETLLIDQIIDKSYIEYRLKIQNFNSNIIENIIDYHHTLISDLINRNRIRNFVYIIKRILDYFEDDDIIKLSLFIERLCSRLEEEYIKELIDKFSLIYSNNKNYELIYNKLILNLPSKTYKYNYH